jgi:hypothetical protein
VKCAVLAIEVHRHPAVTAILDVRGIDGGVDLVAANRAPPAKRELAVYSGLQATLHARLVTQTCPSRRLTSSRSKSLPVEAVVEIGREVSI